MRRIGAATLLQRDSCHSRLPRCAALNRSVSGRSRVSCRLQLLIAGNRSGRLLFSRVEDKVRAAEAAVVAIGSLPNRDVRLDVLFVDDRIQQRCRPVSGVARAASASSESARSNAVDHRLGRFNFVSLMRRRGLNVNDDPGLQIDQVVGGVRVEGRSTWRRCPSSSGSVGDRCVWADCRRPFLPFVVRRGIRGIKRLKVLAQRRGLAPHLPSNEKHGSHRP